MNALDGHPPMQEYKMQEYERCGGFAKSISYTISRYKRSFRAATSVLWTLAAAMRPRPPAGRARPPPLHIKKALASKWY